MYNKECIDRLISTITQNDGKATKDVLSEQVKEEFGLLVDRSLYCGECFSIRFSSSKTKNPSNTVLSLAKVKQYDNNPLFVCIVTPEKNYLLLANSTFIKKISHSSQILTRERIRGSFNASDIERVFDGIENCPDNFEQLYMIHESFSFEENLARIVDATNGIVPTGKRFNPTEEQRKMILDAPRRTVEFLNSSSFSELKLELDSKTESVKEDIHIIESIVNNNVNVRGRLVEYFIASDDLKHKKQLIDKVKNKEIISDLKTKDDLGDYSKNDEIYKVETDIKSKILKLNSAPKGYNVDKLLEFLSSPGSVYLLYIVALNGEDGPLTKIASIFQNQILDKTKIQKHWAGRNSRGVAQFDGKSLEYFLEDGNVKIEIEKARNFLERLIDGEDD